MGFFDSQVGGTSPEVVTLVGQDETSYNHKPRVVDPSRPGTWVGFKKDETNLFIINRLSER